ncbi:hypothetical protein PHYBOEH_007435 [Phytophthora boehmeriae]|uniref:WW domain-containing protein n=1 Tax=Phytophthora boehmeriae TaxID=109152 RepID=A0A8T1W6A1_9STRA|nr:hypothetical protein PHYBOEH_007435 [Phytophthora boehmeriae]
MVKKSARVYVDDSLGGSNGSGTTVAGAMDAKRAEKKSRRKLVSRLSHDISTEQLFSDKLIDGKVADGDNDSGSDNDSSKNFGDSNVVTHGGMYRIESHSALSSLDAKYLEKVPSTEGNVNAITGVEPRPTARTHKLAPLPGSPTTRNTEPVASSSPFRPASLSATSEKEEQEEMKVCGLCSKSRDMPPMHCAAYNGHTNCLELLLQKVDVEAQHLDEQATNKKTTWLDKKQRTPLFYACAANRLDCCALLARVRKVWLDAPDRQLDTPVHVCCFFGWNECLQLLLDAGADPHGRNAKGFKPSHLAATPACLEALLAFGDDLLQGDKLGRSPLFVACARNRVACVEFLCAWNNQSRSWMLELEDQRGDRAIHAAACNGSTESLSVLLRYGSDPLTANSKGMSPKDLASTNKHFECEALLAHAEHELAANAGTSWLAPANAAVDSNDYYDANAEDNNSDWIQCWDNDSGQAFYYNNLTGKCQWEIPPGFNASQQPQQDSQQYKDYSDTSIAGGEVEDNEEYVWVKKKKQTVCVVTGRKTEWTAVQDPLSRAIYYKNTRTGQSQWEEPDAVRQLANAAVARTSQEVSRVWEDLDAARSALAAALAREKRRQFEAHEHTLLQSRLHIRQRRDDIRKREEQARLAQLLPRSSFVRRKKQSMMMKVTTHNRQATKTSGKLRHNGANYSSLGENPNENDEESEGGNFSTETGNDYDEKEEGGAEARLEEICANEPALDMFLSTYLKLRGVRDLQVLTTEKRLSNCLFHFYVALVDPVNQRGMSKSQFRVVLRDMNVIPGGVVVSSTPGASLVPSTKGGVAGVGLPPLKLHVTDLVFSQAERAISQEGSPTHGSRLAHRQTAPLAASGDVHLSLSGFTTAMQIIRERVVAQAEQSLQQSGSDDPEIDDEEEWFMLRYLVPLALRLGARLLTQIRRCKELDLQLTELQESTGLTARQLLTANRAGVQLLHRYYSRRELLADTEGAVSIISTPKKGASRRLAVLTFRGLAMFTNDFNLLPPGAGLPALHFLLEAINWISGSAHTEVISFEKFQLILVMLAVTPLSLPNANVWGSWEGDSTGASSPSPPRLLAEPLAAFFKRLACSPALIRVTAESGNSTFNDDVAGESGPIPTPSRTQSLFVLVPPVDSTSHNQE